MQDKQDKLKKLRAFVSKSLAKTEKYNTKGTVVELVEEELRATIDFIDKWIEDIEHVEFSEAQEEAYAEPPCPGPMLNRKYEMGLIPPGEEVKDPWSDSFTFAEMLGVGVIIGFVLMIVGA